jgi:hypothetical protein
MRNYLSYDVIPLKDNFTNSDALGGVVGTTNWPLELATNTINEAGSTAEGTKDNIPEIDIKVDSVAVTAVTKKAQGQMVT